MELFKTNLNIQFMAARRWTTLFSIILIAGSLFAIFHFGLKLGLDFTGGLQIEVSYSEPANLSNIRNELAEKGFSDAVVQSYGNAFDVLISLAPREDLSIQDLQNSVLAALTDAKLQRVEFIGPQVGEELAAKGLLALILAFLGSLIYITLRFEYRFAVSAIIALLHDPLLILGIFALFQIEFNLTTLAALLTVIGYSINDTIVVFDRVRENFRKYRKLSVSDIMDKSINQTLSRTILTSGLTLLVVVSLFIFGGEALSSFSLALIIGIVVGTYSSIYIAGAMAVSLGLKRDDLIPSKAKEIDEMP